MLAHYTEFNQAANRVVTDAFNRTRILSAAIGAAAAALGMLPTAAVDSPAEYFQTSVLPALSNQLSVLNEKLVFDIHQTVEFTRMFWRLRYSAAHPGLRPLFGEDSTFVENLVGATFSLPEESRKFLNEHQRAILSMANHALSLISKLTAPVLAQDSGAPVNA